MGGLNSGVLVERVREWIITLKSTSSSKFHISAREKNSGNSAEWLFSEPIKNTACLVADQEDDCEKILSMIYSLKPGEGFSITGDGDDDHIGIGCVSFLGTEHTGIISWTDKRELVDYETKIRNNTLSVGDIAALLKKARMPNITIHDIEADYGQKGRRRVAVTRTGYAEMNIIVEAECDILANEMALDEAGDYEFTEHSFDYELA
jgi:hypothetical protein